MTRIRNTITEWIDARLNQFTDTIARRVIDRANARIEKQQ